MPKIIIIDDNQDLSDTLRKQLSRNLRNLGSDLDVITRLPFKARDQYYAFLDSEDACALILDQRLTDIPLPGGDAVGYQGNDLGIELRKKLKDIPIFVITAYPTDAPGLKESFGDFENIIGRNEFNDNSEQYTKQILRTVHRYFKENRAELYELGELSTRIAQGETSDEALQQLESLQVKLAIPISDYPERTAWLNGFEVQIDRMNELRDLLERRLEEK